MTVCSLDEETLGRVLLMPAQPLETSNTASTITVISSAKLTAHLTQFSRLDAGKFLLSLFLSGIE